MSLSVGGFHPGYTHPGPMGVTSAQEFYSQYQQMRYPDYYDRNYFHNWVLSGTPEIPMSPDPYVHEPPPVDYGGGVYPHVQFESYTNQYGERCIKRKVNASKKERRRTQSLNNAFTQLRDCIPNVPSDTKLSKIKTLRLAISYISYLMDILSKDDPKLTEKGFKAEISRKRERHDISKLKEFENLKPKEEKTSPLSTDSKKDKRSGWPEHVWASELKQTE